VADSEVVFWGFGLKTAARSWWRRERTLEGVGATSARCRRDKTLAIALCFYR
jgi:hypothetical protein